MVKVRKVSTQVGVYWVSLTLLRGRDPVWVLVLPLRFKGFTK